MKPTRREFGALLGAVAVPTIRPGATPTAAEDLEAQLQTGAVSADVALTMLDVQGERGIYADPRNLDELRTSLVRKFREHQTLRSLAITDDVQPLLAARR